MKTLSGLPAIVAGGLTAIATVQGFTPPSGQSAIDHAATLTQRNALAAAHDIGGSSEQSFTGWTDTTGWNTTTVTTADGLRSAITGAGATESLVITCNFNTSAPSGSAANGVATGSLSANGAVDYGYDRPGQKIRVVAGEGYSPVINGDLELNGLDYIEFNGFQFDGTVTFEDTNGYATLAIAAFHNCQFGDEVAGQARSVHIEDCTFTPIASPSFGPRFIVWCEWARIWNCKFHRITVNTDPIINFLFTRSYMANWIVKRWCAGCLMYNANYSVTGGNHSDFFQYSTPGDTHDGYDMLFEFNIILANQPDSQGFFGDDASTTSDLENNMVVHNNIIITNSNANIHMFDESGNGDMRSYRNLIGRGSKLDPSGVVDSQVQIQTDNGASGTGVIDIRECFGVNNNGYALNTVTEVGNVRVDTKANASAGTKMEDVYTMSGANFTTDAYGRIIYDTPDDGVTDPATARAAIIAFYEPIAGWNDGTGCGPIDPAEWPTTFGGALS